jgi:uncharacterized circularly permuted ATP-grasp superfamily protein/uncharacterized alpha-E superfamily protein
VSLHVSDDRVAATLLEAHYRLIPGILDELIAPDGSIRPHWRRFVAAFGALPAEDLAARLRKAERLRTENGIAFTVAGGAEGSERPWTLDFVPLLIDEDEWAALERGLIQRARLLDAVLADLYGPQRLLREGDLPAALVFANPHFLRPCHGIEPRGGRYLQFYAADLGRGPDGRWWVLSDRTQAPVGFGYALENRIILARALPEVFRAYHIQRLAPFFNALNSGLVAATRRDDPRIVLLTSSDEEQTAFDHAYLARYLGYTLAVGADLTVRNERVFLKTVEGLMPVDLIIRGIDSELCDPLDLDVASTCGIAGLVQAARAGRVGVANALGSGLIEAKAFMAFLPALCRSMFGEDLLLPNTATWWCGQEAARQHVLATLDDLAVDHAFERRPMLAAAAGPLLSRGLSAASLASLRDRLVSEGHNYVGQELVSLSTTPVLADGALEPRPMALRVFLCASEDGYALMPGGLTRVAATRDPRAALLRRGQETKDTWVLSSRPVSAFSLLRTDAGGAQPQRKSKDIPSRSADNLFWLGRYAERAEDAMRVLRTVVRRLTVDTIESGDAAALARAMAAILEKTGIDAGRPEEVALGPTVAIERQAREVMFKVGVPYGVVDTLQHLERTAALARDWLSVEAWQTLSGLRATARPPRAGRATDPADIFDVLEQSLRVLAAFSGMEMENMTRDHGWRFLDMGRRLERAAHLSRLMRCFLERGDPEDDGRLVLLLEIADSVMTYRWRYLATPMVAPVLDVLLLDESNPRSVAFQLAALNDHVEQLPRSIAPPARSVEQRIMLATLATLRLAEPSTLCAVDADQRRAGLAEVFDAIDAALPKLSEAITRSYFSHAESRRPAELSTPPSKP